MKKMAAVTAGILFTCAGLFGQSSLGVQVHPSKAWIEKGEHNQFLNFDFLVQNNSSDTLTLSKITVFVYDRKGRLIQAQFLDNNGTAPSIETLVRRMFAPGTARIIFNPFSSFSPVLDLFRLDYEFVFTNTKEEDTAMHVTMQPQTWFHEEKYMFPLKGKVLVYDGHDYYAHHRRFDYSFAPIKELGITANFMRYAYDFVLLDSSGNRSHNNGEKDEDYIGFGQAVYAIGTGEVIYASNVHRDDKTFDIPGIAKNSLELYGNCIAIRHLNNTVSVYGHLKQNSLKVKTGDHVLPGQEIAAIGVSGSSFFPHLHFEVRTGITNASEGIPSYFSNIFILQDDTRIKLSSGLPETGNVLFSE